MRKRYFLIILLVLILVVIGLFVFGGKKAVSPANEEAKNTADVLPAENKLGDLIIVESPLAGGQISSPLKFSGKARGTWFFEGSFPVILTNWDGLIIAQGIATAKSEWMTEDFVPFAGELSFQSPIMANADYTKRGSIIFKKDNPSGLPEHDKALEFQVFFK